MMRSIAVTVGFEIGAQHGIHAGQVTPALLLEPVEHIVVDAQMDRRFLRSQCRNQSGMIPKASIQFDLFRIRPRGSERAAACHFVDFIEGCAPDIAGALVVPYARQ